MRRGRIPKHRKDLDARRVKVAEYLRDRLSYSEIGKILGISKNAVASDVKKIVANWKEQQKDSYDEHVMIQLGLINEVINKLKNRTKPPKQPPQQPPKQSPQQQTQQKPVAGEVDPYGEQYDLPDLTPPNMS